MITFVTYYIKPSKTESGRFKALYKVLHRQSYTPCKDPDEVLSMFFASVKKYHPDARLCLITDGHSKFDLDPSIEIFRYPRKSNALDMEVLRALIHFMKNEKKETNTIFMEWDHLVQGPMYELFLRKADLYLPYRRIRPLPFDDSFMAIGSGHFREVAGFFRVILKQYKRLESNILRYWYGKSLIYSKILYERMVEACRNNKTILALRFKDVVILPVIAKRYSMRYPKKMLDEFHPEPLAIHFSNAKRPYMKAYWEKYLKDRPVD